MSPPPPGDAISEPSPVEADNGEDAGDEDGEDEERTGKEAEGVPDWMDDEGEGTSVDATSDGEIEPPDGVASDQPTGASEGSTPSREGGMGIVGEPTALGEPNDESEREASSTAAPDERRSKSGRSRSAGWVGGARRGLVLTGIGVAALVIILGGIGLTYFASSPSTETPEPTAPSDSSASAEPDSVQAATSNRPPPADLTLGPTLHLTVRAQADVEGIRIQRDDDLRRPYWIKEGEAEVYPFSTRILVTDQLDNVQLYLEGYRYPAARQSDGEITITREIVEDFADTLRGAPVSLSVPVDTIPIGQPAGVAPPPDTTAPASS
jgi:hypothetical protein